MFYLCVSFNQPVPKPIYKRLVFLPAKEDGDTFRFLDDLGPPAGIQDDSKAFFEKTFDIIQRFLSFHHSIHPLLSCFSHSNSRCLF